MADIHKASPDIILLGERAQQLDMLLHVQEFSAMAVLITGPSNIGKTTLLSAAATQLTVHHQTIQLNAFETNQLPDVIDAISISLGCPANLVDLDTQLSKLSAQQETLHILVDDAHLLSDDALQVLLEKSTLEHGWRLILCGDESLKARLNAIQNQFDNKLYHLIELTPFTEEESEAFISQLFKRSGIDVVPISIKDMHQLWLISKGVPGKLLELVELEQDNQRQKTGRFPIGHIAAVALIGSALLVSYMYQGQNEEISDEDAIATLLKYKQSEMIEKRREAQTNQGLTEEELEPKIEKRTSDYKVEASTSMASERLAEINVKPLANVEKSSESIPKRVETQPNTLGKIAVKSSNVSVEDKASALHPLLLAPSQSYALQLLGVRNEDSAKAFVKRFERQIDGAKLNVYETRYQGEPWYVVVYGPIGNKSLANQEANKLSKTINGQPWVRPISKIQADIREIPIR